MWKGANLQNTAAPIYAPRGRLRGASVDEFPPYRMASAAFFDKVCRLSGLSSVRLCAELRVRLGRRAPCSRRTLRAWRQGRSAVPFEVVLAVARLAEVRFPAMETLLLGEVIDDPELRHKAIFNAVRRHYGLPPAPMPDNV